MKIKITISEKDLLICTLFSIILFFIGLVVGGSAITLKLEPLNQLFWGFLFVIVAYTLGVCSLVNLMMRRQER